ncbi:MAG TPA: aspartate--tRNA ligase [Thermoanaerobaculia bacterium]|nr:aspartate--tRNA ligase [Thermoanaerobaculia bacterium]
MTRREVESLKRAQAGSLRIEDVGRRVLLAGWVQKQRDLGELVFVDLRDRSGVCQIVIDERRAGSAELVAKAKQLRQEFVFRVEGEIVERGPEGRNPKMPTGEVEVLAHELEILGRAEPLPFAIEDEVNATEETRLKYRYLDLRRQVLARNLVLRDRVCHRVRDWMHRNGFLEIETPILTKSTPEGARDYLVPSRVHHGEFYALPQSPQLFKQILMVAGVERYYQIARCFRDEDLRSDRQPEFTQIDIEASFIDEEFVFEMIEGLFMEIFSEAGIVPQVPFPRMQWQRAMDWYGTDRPDLRFGMEIADLGEAVASIAFEPFGAALSSGGTVRGIVVPNGAGASRKRLDDLTEQARALGASGLIWVRFGDEPSSSIRKFLAADDYPALRSALGAADGDLALIVAGPWKTVVETLGELRLRIAREGGLIPAEKWKFVWITDFPLFEYDEPSGRWFARHHPFTSPKPEDLEKLESDPGSTGARAYDVVLNGLELGGGSIRIHDVEVQQRMFRALGIDAEEARERFGFLLDGFRYGAPPHGGIALGLDRIVMLMARAGSIRDVIAFPKTTRAQDLMTDAPSGVSTSQLDELGIRLK